MNTELATRMQKNTASEEPYRVLFVCTGNTCRSPMAAALYNDMTRPREVCSACPDAAESVSIHGIAFSAGLYAAEGAPISPEAVSALQQAGVAPIAENDYTTHTARNVTRQMMQEADLVVAITAAHAMELTLRYPEFASKIVTMPMDIDDPYGQGETVYRMCLLQLRYCLQLLCKGAES